MSDLKFSRICLHLEFGKLFVMGEIKERSGPLQKGMMFPVATFEPNEVEEAVKRAKQEASSSDGCILGCSIGLIPETKEMQ